MATALERAFRARSFADVGRRSGRSCSGACPAARRRRQGDLSELKLTKSKVFADPVPGQVLTLELRQTDWLSDPLIAELGLPDAQAHPWFVDLLNNPASCRHPITDRPDLRSAAVDIARTAGVPPSQSDAIAGIVDQTSSSSGDRPAPARPTWSPWPSWPSPRPIGGPPSRCGTREDGRRGRRWRE